MIARYPKLSEEIDRERSEVLDALRGTPADEAGPLRELSLRLAEWRDHVRELEGAAEEIPAALASIALDKVDSIEALVRWVSDAEGRLDGTEDLLADLCAGVSTGPTVEDARAGLVKLRDAVEADHIGTEELLRAARALSKRVDEAEDHAETAANKLTERYEELRDEVRGELVGDYLDAKEVRREREATEKELTRLASLSEKRRTEIEELRAEHTSTRAELDVLLDVLSDEDAITPEILDAALDRARAHNGRTRESDEARARFGALLPELDANKAERATFGPSHPVQVAYEEALRAEFRKLHPRKKLPGELSAIAEALGDRFEPLASFWKEESRKVIDPVIARIDQIEAELRELAQRIIVRASREPGEPALVLSSHVADYASTGNGDGYALARCDAEIAILRRRCPGARPKRENPSEGRSRYRVLAHLDRLDLEVYKRTNGTPDELRERVRLNPRVYWPTLPHSFEEEAGLDRFGKYLPGREPAST